MLLMGLAAGPHEQRGTGHGDNVRSGMSRGERAERTVTVASYVHGYSEHEALRLGDQADILAELLHADTAYPAGSRDVVVRPRTVYADQTRPAFVSGFTRNTFTAMVEAVRHDALAAGLISQARWDQGIADLRRTADDGGTFHYAFFKALAVNPARPSP
jgi:hypothetical protein